MKALKQNSSVYFIMLILFFFFGGNFFLFSHEKTGNLSGIVEDEEGNTLPGVTIVAWSPPAKTTHTSVTNEQGRFRFSNLPAGAYTVTFSMGGFETLKKEKIMVQSGQTVHLRVTMEYGPLLKEEMSRPLALPRLAPRDTPQQKWAKGIKVGALTEEDVAAIRASSEAFLQAWRIGDWAALASLHTEDAIFMFPNQSAIQGRDAVRASIERLPLPIKANLAILEIDGRGDLAYVRGKYTHSYEPIAGIERKYDTWKYIWILRKQQDSSWFISILIFNSDQPLPSEKE